MNPTKLRNHCLSFTGAEETFPFGPETSNANLSLPAGTRARARQGVVS
jgi:hypothetical protein